MDRIEKITDEIFEDYLYCKYKSYLRLHNHIGDKTEFEIFQKNMDNIFCSNAMNKLRKGFMESDLLSIPILKKSDLKKNKALILETWIELDEIKSSFHGLRRYSIDVESSTSYYEPVLYCRHERVTRFHKLILTFKAVVIGRLQNHIPDRGIIIYGKKCTVYAIAYSAQTDQSFRRILTTRSVLL